MSVVKRKVDFVVSHTKAALIGISIGVIASIVLMTFHPFEKVIVHVPKVVEKPVIVKVPIKLTEDDKKQIVCMTMNAYFEARNQGTPGIIAVDNVVMNRTKHPEKFGDTPCKVTHQKTNGTWQFSWHGENVGQPKDINLYAEIYNISQNVYLGNISDTTGGATYYHASYVSPEWHHMKKTLVLGEHIFYKKTNDRSA